MISSFMERLISQKMILAYLVGGGSKEARKDDKIFKWSFGRENLLSSLAIFLAIKIDWRKEGICAPEIEQVIDAKLVRRIFR